jgi:transposase
MAGRRFEVADVVEVLQLWQAGHSLRQLATSLGMGRVRLRQIVAAAEAAGLSPGGSPLTREQLAEVVLTVFAGRLDDGAEQREHVARYHEQIVAGLTTNTVRTVWQRLRDESGLRASETTFRRYVQRHVRRVREEDVTVRKEPTPPGEVGEIDYGFLTRVPGVGGSIRVHGFVMALPSSRHFFADPVDRCDEESWVRSHVAAFEFFGGAPRILRLDNLKTGVLRPDIYDPRLNRGYAEMAEHYGVVLDPCRAGRPKDKPHVERAIPYVRDSLARGREHLGLSGLRDEAPRWCRDVAGRRPHRSLPGTVLEVFETVERPALLALPSHPFEIAHWAKATVHPDCHVQVRGRLYTVPWQNVGRRVDVRVGERVVRIYDAGELLKTHVLQRGLRRYTDPDDLPPSKVAFLLRTPSWCRRRAAELGPHVAALVDELLTDPCPLFRLRQAQAILRLADTYPAARVDAACTLAAEADGSYRTVKTLLVNGLDVQSTDLATHVSNAGAYLHGKQALLEGVR